MAVKYPLVNHLKFSDKKNTNTPLGLTQTTSPGLHYYVINRSAIPSWESRKFDFLWGFQTRQFPAVSGCGRHGHVQKLRLYS